LKNVNFGVDQAEQLRRIVNNLREHSDGIIKKSANKIKCGARLIVVTSGKGGVGKTSFIVNLAIELKKWGHRVTIIDGDLGLANVEVIMGVVPEFSLHDFIKSDISFSEIVNEGPMGIKFISGGTGIVEMANLDKNKFKRILEAMSRLDSSADYVLVDTGAGMSEHVTGFMFAAREIILLTNPEPTSITDAYTMLKILKNKNHDCEIKIVVNKVENASEAQDVFRKLSSVSNKFLNIKIKNLGYIVDDHYVSSAVKLQEPFIISFPKSSASKNIGSIAQRIMDNSEYEHSSSGVKNFLYRLYGSLNIRY